MKRSTNWFSVLPSLVTPVCLGLVFYIGLSAAIQHQVINDETVLRYLMGHPVSKISVALFFVGISSLLLIGFDVLNQFRLTKSIKLDSACDLAESNDEKESTSEVVEDSISEQREPLSVSGQALALGKTFLKTPNSCHDHYLWQRIANVLESIYRNGSASHVEEELKYLAELDVDQQQQRYSLVQILIWATPMLGFLGTVLGISQALGGISVGPDNNFQNMMDGLKSSLYVAFDTTALALTLSMVMMFGQFLVERFESQLLRVVSHRAHFEIASQFDLSSDNQSERLNEQFESKVISTLELATKRQAELWRESLKWAESSWTQSLQESQTHIETGLSATIDNSIYGLAQTLDESIMRADQAMSHRWEQWQVTLSENARQVAKNQTLFGEQTQAVCKSLQQTAQLTCDATKQITETFNASTLKTLAAQEDVQPVSISKEHQTKFVDLAKESEAIELNHVKKDSNSKQNWISVLPEFMSEVDDNEQVILPVKPVIKRSAQTTASTKESLKSVREPSAPHEVILPFLKKSA